MGSKVMKTAVAVWVALMTAAIVYEFVELRGAPAEAGEEPPS